MLSRIKVSKTAAWQQLKIHHKLMSRLQIQDLFSQDKSRFQNYSLSVGDLFLDYSKNLINSETLTLLFELAHTMGLKAAMEAYFEGKPINKTEGRPVLHTALRKPKSTILKVAGQDVIPKVHEVLNQIKTVSNKIISGAWKGCTGKAITDIVNIGIGGSDLGPRMITEALKPYHNHLKVHFISNVDAQNLNSVLNSLKADTTLFIIASKTFTTQETITNAKSAKAWFLHALTNSQSSLAQPVQKHFVAVSTNASAVRDFGIDTDNMFVFWDWVGGRFSWASSIGLSIACTIGYDNFKALLRGANHMDDHFHNNPFETNMPILLALISLWHINFCDAQSEAILPYDHYLRYLPAYLQQMIMESNGKNIDRNGDKVDYQTASVVWGGAGTNVQHSFFQLLHQGTLYIPCDFLVATNSSDSTYDHHHSILIANCFAQSQALMQGKSEREVRQELQSKGLSDQAIKKLLPYKVFEGNRPSNTLIYKTMTPQVLGSLIALYEHKVFVQGVIWNIYSFDQWGVELGKQLANTILTTIQSGYIPNSFDQSTAGLVNYYCSTK